MKLSENAIKVLEKRILQKDDNDQVIETPYEMFKRVGNHVSSIESDEFREYYATKFIGMMDRLDFLPNSPTLRNAGANNGNLAACFVIPIADSRQSIFKALSDAVEVQAFGGGTGYDFSSLRPRGSLISTTKGKSSGPIGFMKIFDFVVGEIIEQGGVRKGAQMGILRCDHPDIVDFIQCKQEEGQLKHFNISVAITDGFMQNIDTLYPTKFSHMIPRHLWDIIREGAWRNGEPGVVFIDTINRDNPLREYQTIYSTNPCGEQPLGPYESCVLGSINLSNFVEVLQDTRTINFERLKEIVQLAVRFLDNVIDVNNYPITEIETETKRFRKIGLGVMGWADMLIKLEITYGSSESFKIAGEIMSFINSAAHKYSQLLASEKGETVLGRRNGTLTTIAPTGTLSLIAGCSSGIEPIFSFKFKKKVMDGEIEVVHPLYADAKAKIGTMGDLGGIICGIPEYFIESKDIPIESHVRMQAAFQKYTDNAVSKTINAPHDATLEDVDKAFRLAYQLGCKGITFYRQGSREEEAQVDVLKTKSPQQHYTQEQKDLIEAIFGPTEPPDYLEGSRDRVRTGEGTLYVHLFEDPVTGYKELWSQISKEGRTLSSMNAAIGRLATLALNKGASWVEVEKQLRGIVGEKTGWHDGQAILSPPDGIAKVIRKRKLSQHSSTVEHLICNQTVGGSNPSVGPMCPDCGEMLEIKEGCSTCPWCGWSNCS